MLSSYDRVLSAWAGAVAAQVGLALVDWFGNWLPHTRPRAHCCSCCYCARVIAAVLAPGGCALVNVGLAVRVAVPRCTAAVVVAAESVAACGAVEALVGPGLAVHAMVTGRAVARVAVDAVVAGSVVEARAGRALVDAVLAVRAVEPLGPCDSTVPSTGGLASSSYVCGSSPGSIVCGPSRL